MHIHTHTYIYIYIYMHIYLSIYLSISLSLYIYMCTFAKVCRLGGELRYLFLYHLNMVFVTCISSHDIND